MSRSVKTKSRSSIRNVAEISPSQPEPGAPTVPRLHISGSQTPRPMNNSIYDRYLKRNEMWLGHHCSTRLDEAASSRS